MISKLISRIQIKYFRKNILAETDFDFDDQLKFLNSIKEPMSDFNRTYMQHCCQMRHVNPVIKFILGIASMFSFPFLALLFVLKGISFRKPVHTDSDCIVFLSCSNGKPIYPKELEEKYSNVIEADFFEGKSLLLKDVFFVLRFVIRYPFSFWLSLRMLFRVAAYRYIIKKFNPKAIVVTIEVSPAASSLTSFCEINNIEHINILSGERLLEISASFIHFHKFYVWDDHYIKLFMKLRADKRTNFIIHTPVALRIDLVKNRIENKVVDFTYYLAVFTEIEIKKISDLVETISSFGYSIRLRPHHRWTNMTLLRKHIKEINIEDNMELSIEESIASTNTAIGVSTTVLLQSVMSGREIIIDDVIYREKYNNLKMRNYIIYSKPHKRLSDILLLMENNNIV